MAGVTTQRGGRRHALGAIAGLLLGLASACNATADATPAAVVDSSPDSNWQTIEYHGVRVDIPVAWERSDMDDCEFKFEHWAPLDSGACGRGSGVSFYASATFDPAHGPGVHRSDTAGAAEPSWGGYVGAGDVDVYVADDSRDLVVRVLDSVRDE